MSATRYVSVRPAVAPGPRLGRAPGSAASWLWFIALAVYGTVRWGTMLPASDQGRMVLSLVVAIICAAGLRRLPARRLRRWAFGPVLVLGFAAELGAAGFSLTTVAGLHLGRLDSALSRGISDLSNVLVPYAGGDAATIAVIVLGAGLLLLGGGAIFATVSEAPGTGRLALAAVPLVALAVVPSAIGAPRLAYFHGLLTFTLGALFVFSPRLVPERRGGAAALLAVAGVIGATAAGLVAGDRVWLRVATGARIVTGIGSGPVDEFNWQQTYGIQDWPHVGATVLTVTARRPAHWKAENLDDFTGTRWAPERDTGSGGGGGSDGGGRSGGGASAAGDIGLTGISRAHLGAYSETIHVTVGQLSSQLIIAAGYAGMPNVIGATPNVDAGTWVTANPLETGESYEVKVYVPDPPAAQLAAAGIDYPPSLAPFRTLGALPRAYDGVETLARQLASGTSNPYEYVEAVLGYLQRGYVYTLKPPPGGAYPLANFLLSSRRGYCQQFAGAMALLLRMHDIPARVAVGFSSGTRESGTDTYRVTDRDAHAWVEAWFPSFGWVTFDPTPGTAVNGVGTSVTGATGATATTPGQLSTPATGSATGTTNIAAALAQAARERLARLDHPPDTGGGGGHEHASSIVSTVILGILGGLGLLTVVVHTRALWRRPSVTELTAELERAFARCGRPLGTDVTFAALTGRLSDNPPAAMYVSALGTARYERHASPPTAAGRAALRRWLAADLGIRGRLRALWALPPRRPPAGAP